MTIDQFTLYCLPTFFIDSDHEKIIAFSSLHAGSSDNPVQKAVSIFYAVRDQIRYDPYEIPVNKEGFKASRVLTKGRGFCVSKAVLLTACLRAQSIPARLGFADVKNHLTTPKLKAKMGTDLFKWHGYTDIFLEGKWVKATPTFNLSLCRNFAVKPLEFDGRQDSVFHAFDTKGQRHMEYVKDHGHFADLPWDRMMAAYRTAYPNYFKSNRTSGDFHAEAKELRNGTSS
ncbi:transglutaminase family protein [uncultured Desulfobacter sp.]|uniref:transglutaminase-like domain-containing protein n=1 Tax=uncultured Desulfobacter sp. TaxID=240139 RepID=UPI0029F49F5A|nr:transglutaminase family protein [uncultured Desulfobacter sp.]